MSVKYDPFELISLPIPARSEFTLEGFEIEWNHKKVARKFRVKVAQNSQAPLKVSDLMEQYTVARKDNSLPEQFELTFVGFSVHGTTIPLDRTLSEVYKQTKDNYFKPRLFMFEKTPEEI